MRKNNFFLSRDNIILKNLFKWVKYILKKKYLKSISNTEYYNIINY